MKLAYRSKIVAILLTAGALASCTSASSESDRQPAPSRAASSPSEASLPALTICAMPDPKNPASAFEIERGAAQDLASRWVDHACKQPCERWQDCAAEAFNRRGEVIPSGRDEAPKRQLALVVDGMGGHLAFTPDGDKTVLFQHGGGGAMFPQHPANMLEQATSARTVMLRWAPGARGLFFPLGWFTRNSPEPTDVRRQSRRIAAVLQWVHDHLSDGQAFGTVADSMGSVATFGAVLWHGLDPIIDYQLLIGGPPMWDVNAGCGLVRYQQGYCGLDGATPCRQDQDCQSVQKGECRKPEPLPTNSPIWEGIINYLYVSDACHPLPEGAADAPHPPFDSSGFRTSGVDWEVDHPVDFMIDLGGAPTARTRGGDEYWAIGQFTFVYNRIDEATPTSWQVSKGTHHSQSMHSDAAVAAIKKGLGLQ